MRLSFHVIKSSQHVGYPLVFVQTFSGVNVRIYLPFRVPCPLQVVSHLLFPLAPNPPPPTLTLAMAQNPKVPPLPSSTFLSPGTIRVTLAGPPVDSPHC